ncbi:hypothetical protein FOXG_14046 [Fusarium oxysporum f. sp. lycopersici 4287]|uniref:VWFA domain-containing protein n=2 Tax=Fusarium oxysporum TaxID=5507 RepID=A0A0J9VT44_FUSO4|nr:hypothetical protein FOXG_12493 [Fusarium oxysporum f. sp. lycopersici 4287]XP_018253583.1 hypothetical protein FOXG_14046 [Fusarium oxysporum f. sp. lycopersici 4287]EWZ79185.1 hypothetical protein FOWG_16634 [Fusarium oxysporum f. sp. lycopersici MN25]KAJ9413057.1 hypothetical protein QL093DRAFT_2527320 [Fusarium oxysporum]KNB13820.1 hypothetical protein FOXG_12493 [Fusarium oxysporum f. sp. lycopersici 4287]KNB15538.1 hypothetical protein FOXG_14046 [Fusarium oxysporum f. sp. lycopersici
MFSRFRNKFLTKKSSVEDRTHFNNSKSTPKSKPFLDVPEEAPPAYEPTQRTAPLLNVPRRGASPAPSISSTNSAEDRLAFLSTFDTIFVIDDSGSMAGQWGEVQEALSTIAPICTSHDPDGIDVYFLNHRSPAIGTGVQAPGGYFQIRDANQVQHLFKSVRPCGATPTGSRLHSILKPYVAHLSRRAANVDSTKPVNIIVITDGSPSDDPESIIVHHAKKLDQIEAPPHQVGIQFFQVGNDFGATKALRKLDDDLADEDIRDMVDTVTWNSTTSDNVKALTADGILKVVLGAVVRRLDRQKTRDEPQSG